jgi:chlorobactene lauroyltransferase
MARLHRTLGDQSPAIPAAKHWLGQALVYHGLLRPGLRGGFGRVWLRVVGRLPAPDDGPLIVVLNHPAWWDGHLCALLDREVFRGAFDAYLMMEAPQLRRFRFFTWMGAFSVDRHDAREALRSVSYVARLLQERPARACYIFPQGTITPNDRRPLALYPGVTHIVRRAGAATICPVALRYELRGEQRPDAFIRLGPALRLGAGQSGAQLSALVERLLTGCVDRLRDEVLGEQLDEYRVLLHGRPGVDRVFEWVLRWLRPQL